MSSALRNKRQSALAALRARREGGTGAGVSGYKNGHDNASDSDNDLYDEVSEDEYKSIVRGRMMADDFIEDDDGSGYVDDGRDDWDRGNEQNGDADSDESEDADEYYARTGRKKKRAKGGRSKKETKDRKNVDKYGASGIAGSFAKARPEKAASRPVQPLLASRTNVMDAYRPSVAMEKEDDFMKRLMGNLGDSGDGSALGSPSPASRTVGMSASARKRKQETMPALGGRQNAFTHLQRSPTTPPSSDPLDPPSDDINPNVHIAGSDTPPWPTSAGMDGDEPTSKRIRAASRRIGSLGIRDREEEEEDVKPVITSEHTDRRMRSMSRIDSKLFEGLDDDAFLDDEDFGFAVQAPSAAKPSDVKARVNTSGVRAKPAAPIVPQAVPVKVKQEHLDDEHGPKIREKDIAKPEPNLKNNWRTIGANLANVSDASSSPSEPKTAVPALAASNVKPFEPDSGRLRFFWTDYTEQQGTIFITGKVKDYATERFVSACLQVEGVERCVYLLPRQGATEDDVYDEFDSLRQKHGIKAFLAKWVSRKYAFEMSDVPAESHYLKVKYGFDEPQLPLDFSGKTFSKAFGTNTSAFELFVVKRGIMGPCWLDVESADIRGQGSTPLSWCKVELSVDDAKFVKPFADTDANAPRDTPPLTVMSLSLRTVVNHKENKSEIVAVAARTWKDVLLEDPTPPEELQSSLFSCVRPLGDLFPARFEGESKKGATKIITVKYERMLLNSLLAQIQQQDPDVIIGHEFSGVTLDILLHRMRDLRADHWSRIGRLRRQKWPNLRQGFNLRVASGRLIADLASDTAKGMITSTTWSLTEMCASHLKAQREDIDPDDTASFFDALAASPDRLLNFVRHNEVDAYFQMALASKVQLLALTKQLTNLAGNSWSRTMNGGRAERNEYILLHEFHRQKYICPDKLNRSERELMSRQQQAKAHDDDDDAEADGKVAGSNKKDKFKGGLVFDPKRGLWDKYILVMDFNSLYPSLIQEFNIDFTTVDRKDCNDHPEDVDKMPEVPSSDIGQGVLPRLISTLVSRRRQVKSLMKDRNAGAAKQLQWNIKQLALKLTANSMYGCLGFEGSRFYARPLASLTTFKGRETLTATKELAESLGLDVIYGDTDSVMINTNVLDVNEAKRIGNEFKKAVNERYRLLEIDIDGIFERMLLLQKKKYAAIKIDDYGQRATEIKGLDMKRREYCALSKQVSEGVLNHILSGESTETVIESIHEYLEGVAQGIEKLQLDEFIIYKRLSKKVSDYNEQAAKSLPHVQVAKRMQAKGISVRMGDVIPYVFCLGDDGSSSTKSAQAERAYHPDDLRRKDSPLRIDYQHYLSLQLLPPVERLCDSIEGTDRGRLAEHLGLDASKYQSISLHSTKDDRQFVTLDSQTPDEVRFAKCESFEVSCPHCQAQVPFNGIPALARSGAGLVKEEDSKDYIEALRAITAHGLACSRCDGRWGTPFVAMQLEKTVRRHISKYYQAWMMCTEPTCNAVSRVQAINARRCLVPGCRGKVVAQYNDKALYDQLCFLESLFDVQKYIDRLQMIVTAAQNSAQHDGIDIHDNAAVSANLQLLTSLEGLRLPGTKSRHTLDLLKNSVTKYTARSGRRFVALDHLFGWMRVEA